MPQSKVSTNVLKKLADKIGKVLLNEQYLGFFGVDIVVFMNESNVFNILIFKKIYKF